MIKKINDILAGWKMSLIGGLFLVASFALPSMGVKEANLLAWVTIIICGLPLLYLSITRLIVNQGVSKISSAMLISMAMIAAIFIGDLFAAGEVAFIMAIGALLEDMTTKRAKKGIENLIEMNPKKARRIGAQGEETVDIIQIKKGDMIRILPGEIVPVDGLICVGETSIDQSVMTGESLPVDKSIGDKVYSGTLNRFGSIDVEVTRLGEDSSLQRLIKMVKEAEENKAPTQRIADKWASWLVPIALGIAVLAFFVTGEIVRAVTVLVVFCPCALVLATPTAIIAAIGQATKHGVIVKSGEALENMGRLHTIAMDKTGTLTYGKLEVSDIVSFSSFSDEEILQLAASAESRSEHPLGKAIVKKANDEGVSLLEIENFSMEAGKGIKAGVAGKTYYFGSEKHIGKISAQHDEAQNILEGLRKEGKATVLVADETTLIGVIALSDVVRKESKKIVSELKQMGTNVVLLTGDNKMAAEYFAKFVGISDVRAELLPEEKLESVKELQKNGKVCMVGDGVNDAPSLKTADVGVAMGVMGSDIAVDAADVALMTDEITQIPYLKWLSSEAVKTIKIAISLSIVINFVAIWMSFMGYLNPTTGALVHNAGSVLVVLLAALLYDKKYKVPN